MAGGGPRVCHGAPATSAPVDHASRASGGAGRCVCHQHHGRRRGRGTARPDGAAEPWASRHGLPGDALRLPVGVGRRFNVGVQGTRQGGFGGVPTLDGPGAGGLEASILSAPGRTTRCSCAAACRPELKVETPGNRIVAIAAEPGGLSHRRCPHFNRGGERRRADRAGPTVNPKAASMLPQPGAFYS